NAVTLPARPAAGAESKIKPSPIAKTRNPPATTSFPVRKYFMASNDAAITSPAPSTAHSMACTFCCVAMAPAMPHAPPSARPTAAMTLILPCMFPPGLLGKSYVAHDVDARDGRTSASGQKLPRRPPRRNFCCYPSKRHEATTAACRVRADIDAKVENRTTQKSRQSRSRGLSAAASLVGGTTEAGD